MRSGLALVLLGLSLGCAPAPLPEPPAWSIERGRENGHRVLLADLFEAQARQPEAIELITSPLQTGSLIDMLLRSDARRITSWVALIDPDRPGVEQLILAKWLSYPVEPPDYGGMPAMRFGPYLEVFATPGEQAWSVRVRISEDARTLLEGSKSLDLSRLRSAALVVPAPGRMTTYVVFLAASQ